VVLEEYGHEPQVLQGVREPGQVPRAPAERCRLLASCSRRRDIALDHRERRGTHKRPRPLRRGQSLAGREYSAQPFAAFAVEAAQISER
jgi:hypothetical protein